MAGNVIKKIDYYIKDIWKYDIKDDYDNDRLLQEDTLKNALYYHLRRKLGDAFLDKNNLKIYTEFHDGVLKGSGMRPDLVIVEMKEGYRENDVEYLGDADNFESIVAVVELKFQADTYAAESNIYGDFDKIEEYMKMLPESTKYYMGIIHEKYWKTNERRWVYQEDYSWSKNKVTELAASWNRNEEMVFEVFEY